MADEPLSPVIGQIVQALAAGNQNMSALIRAVDGIGGTSVSSAVAAASAVALTTNVAANITTIQLTAGDWDVSAIGYFAGAASTNVTRFVIGIGTSSASFGSGVPTGGYADAFYGSSGIVPATTANPSISVPPVRITLSTTGNVYLLTTTTFTVSTAAAFGRINARPSGLG